MSVNLKVRKKKIPVAVGEDSNRTTCDKTNDQCNIGSIEVSLSCINDKSSQASCSIVGSDVCKTKTMIKTLLLQLVMNIKIKLMNILQIFR